LDLVDGGIDLNWNLIIGGSTTTARTLDFQLGMLIISTGPMPFKYDNDGLQCHGQSPYADNCPVEIVQNNKPLCVDCAPSGGKQWYTTTQKSLYCAVPDLGGGWSGNPRNTVPAKTASSFWYSGSLHADCEKSEFLNSGSCQNCHFSCASCDGGGVNDCTSCVDMTVVPNGASKGPCDSPCDIYDGFYVDSDGLTCKACSGACEGASVCPWNRCSVNCFSGCDICFGVSYNKCDTCLAGYSHNSVDRTCTPDSCDLANGKWYDFGVAPLGQCKDCGTSCKTCSSLTSCQTCFSPTEKVINPSVPGECIDCPITNKKFINTAT